MDHGLVRGVLALSLVTLTVPTRAQERIAISSGASSSTPSDAETIPDAMNQVLLGEQLLPMRQHELQLSGASSWLVTPGESSSSHVLGVSYGVTPRLQLGIAAESVVSVPRGGDASAGFGNLQLGFAYTFWLSSSGFALSGGANAIAPTASGHATESGTGGSVVLAAYKTVGALHSNLSARTGLLVPVRMSPSSSEPSSHEDTVEPFVQSVLSLGVPLGVLCPFGEIGVEHARNLTLDVSVGADVPVTEQIELVIGGLAQIEQDTAWGGGVGLAWAQALGPGP